MNNIESTAIIEKHNKIIHGFIEEYSNTKKPIEVSFRKLLPEIKNIDRYTHLIHTYPAKLLVHIPYFFLNNTVLSKEGDNVLDPFNGSGTVMLESLVAKRNALGADSNPLARLIAEVKVAKLNTEEISRIAKKIITSAKKYKKFKVPNVVNCDYWFHQNSKESLAKLFTAINKVEDDLIRKFFLVSLSNCVKKVSYADPRISVPVKLNPLRHNSNRTLKSKIEKRLKDLEVIDVFEKFNSIVNENLKRFGALEETVDNKTRAKVISNDARKITSSLGGTRNLKKNCIQLIITSPPYAGAQKYIRSSSLNLGWTGLANIEELNSLDKVNIGRENYTKDEIVITETGIREADQLIKQIKTINPKRAAIVCNYLHEMKDALKEMVRVLKPNGYLVLVIGNNKVCNEEFNTQEYFTEFLLNQDLKLQFKLIDGIRSYGLMTKRNKTADIISREWILVFKK